MFVGTILVLTYLVVTLIRWVQTLSTLGSMGDTLAKVETNASKGLAEFRANPCLGMTGVRPQGLADFEIRANKTGYIGMVLAHELNDWANKYGCHVHIPHYVGNLVSHDDVLFEIFVLKQGTDDKMAGRADVFGVCQDELTKTLNKFAQIQPQRNTYQDPRFGMSVLGEIGHRTLSEGINDPSTGNRVLTLITQLLIDTKPADDDNEMYEQVSILPLTANMFIEPLFTPLARDGLGSFDFMLHMIVCLAKIHNNAPERAMQDAARQEADIIYGMLHEHYKREIDRQTIIDVWNKAFKTDKVNG